jgi:nucleoside-diphosphate-sugar epimerase
LAARQVLVTGGGGFLGSAIVHRLIARGDHVRVFARGDYPELRKKGVELVRGDICSQPAVINACRDCELIFHVAAKAGVWGDYREYYRINYEGTIHVLAGQRAHRVPGLIYTSSPSVVFADSDLNGVDESTPYPLRYHAPYPRTKAMAERAVLAANDGGCATVALRPHLIWGPGDNHLVPKIISRARQLRRIGNADPMIDCTYIDNAADAHLLAAERLMPGAQCAGRAYFISNGEPRPLWNIVNGILRAAGLQAVTRSISRPVAIFAALSMEAVYRIMRIKAEPRLTRFVLSELTHAHWFDISAARRDLGYEPRVSIDAGLRMLHEWLSGKGKIYGGRA